MKTTQIKALYNTLQGYLLEAPPTKEGAYITDAGVWQQFHEVIAALNELAGQNYDRFRVKITHGEYWDSVSVVEYRSKLHGLIMCLHAEYFADENVPFTKAPGIVLNQSQQQTQSIQLIIALEMQDLIDKKLYTGDLKPEEKSFLETVKEQLSSIKSVTDLLNIIITTAKSSGLTLDQVKILLGF